jgi:hypothetical protein
MLRAIDPGSGSPMATMPRVICKALIGLACSLPALCGVAAAQDVVVKRFGGGSGVNAVGIIDASEDTEINGPQALTAGENGDLYLLDQVNNRIVRFDPRKPSTDPRILGLPEDMQPTDLVVRKSDILVWDGSVRALQAKGADDTSYRGLEEVSTRAAEDQFALSAFAQMGSQAPGSDTDLLDANTRAVKSREPRPRARQFIASRGAGSVIVDIIPDRTGNGALIQVRPKEDQASPDPQATPQPAPTRQLRVKVADRLGAVEFLEVDQGGRMFVLVENIPVDSMQAATVVARYSPTGVLEGLYELPLDSNVPLTRRFVTISGEGDVYFMRTQKTGVDVVGVGFRGIGKSKVIDVRPKRPNVFAAFFGGKGPLAAVRPLDRQLVIETAFAFEGIQWRLTANAHGRDPDNLCTGFNGRIRRPGYLINKLNQEVRGVPYCWGCHGSLSQFRAKIERGMMAGNVCTRNAPRTDVTGVDCSAFVSAAWGLATHFTTAAIPAISTPLSNGWDLRPGDALNKPHSHVMLFLRFTPDRKAEVIEASPGACNGRVCRNVYPLASLLARGYTPVRFKALANDTSVVAQAMMPEEPRAKAKKKRR